jgi:ABC-type transporter Mla MlaB component
MRWHAIRFLFCCQVLDRKEKTNMLRITRTEKAEAEINLIVEGRLVGAWVSELQTAAMEADSENTRVHLDLSGVHFVDALGLALLHRLLNQGIVLQGVSPFVQQLMKTSPLS